jgi:hypothetical protein
MKPAAMAGRAKSLSKIRSTSGIARNLSGSSWDGAAGRDDLGGGPLAARTADRLTSLADRLGGDGAAVDDHRSAPAGMARRIASLSAKLSRHPSVIVAMLKPALQGRSRP